MQKGPEAVVPTRDVWLDQTGYYLSSEGKKQRRKNGCKETVTEKCIK
jgi:hypothetical protein